MRLPLLAPLLALVVATSCGGQSPAPPAGPLTGEGKRVLFIGNSLTYYNDLPELVRVLADSAGTRLLLRVVAHPDYALEDHWAQGDARREIARGGWDFVVLQQGPSSVEANRAHLRTWTRTFAGALTAAGGGMPSLYSVWPSAARRADFAPSIESYALAASDVNGLFLPVASAWLAAWRRDVTLPLYHPDGLHPSPSGSYLAAVVITARLTGKSPAAMPTRLRLADGTTFDAGAAGTVLRAAAVEAIEALGAR